MVDNFGSNDCLFLTGKGILNKELISVVLSVLSLFKCTRCVIRRVNFKLPLNQKFAAYYAIKIIYLNPKFMNTFSPKNCCIFILKIITKELFMQKKFLILSFRELLPVTVYTFLFFEKKMFALIFDNDKLTNGTTKTIVQ